MKDQKEIFSENVLECEKSMYALAIAMLKNENDAADVIQESIYQYGLCSGNGTDTFYRRYMHVFIIRDYSEDENNSGMVEPHIKDKDGIEENKLLSIDEDEIIENILKKFYEDMDLKEEDSISIEYEVLRNTHSSFEMKITINNFTENGDSCIKYYHVDRIHGRYETLQTMMAREGIAAMEAYILQELESQQIGISENATIIHKDQNYYYNEANELVIVLNKAELGAGEIGYLEIMIPTELYLQYIYL